MAHEIKGKIEVEKGLRFPLITTVDRLAYTPPQKGYLVYDTDLSALFYWNGTTWKTTNIGGAPTLEYVNVYLSGSPVSVANNAAIPFDTILSGAIPYNTSNGQFTLTAGVTYMIRGNALPSTSSRLNMAWYNVTLGVTISPSGSSSSANVASDHASNQAEVIYTPSVNSVIELRNISGSARNVSSGSITPTGVSGAASQAMIVALGTP